MKYRFEYGDIGLTLEINGICAISDVYTQGDTEFGLAFDIYYEHGAHIKAQTQYPNGWNWMTLLHSDINAKEFRHKMQLAVNELILLWRGY